MRRICGAADEAEKATKTKATKIANTFEFMVVRYSRLYILNGVWSQFIVNRRSNSTFWISK